MTEGCMSGACMTIGCPCNMVLDWSSEVGSVVSTGREGLGSTVVVGIDARGIFTGEVDLEVFFAEVAAFFATRVFG